MSSVCVCVWKRAPAPKTDEVTAKRVSVIAPSTSQAGIKRPVTQGDREWILNSLAQLGRFTGLGWILAPETPQTVPIKTFDGVVTSSGYGNAEDKALMAYRHERITASNFGLVLAALKRNSYPPSLFKTLLGQYNLKQGSHACDWGILHEPKAKQEYMERTGVTIQERGVFLSDRWDVADDFIIEVKCPYSARTKTNLQAAERKDFFLELDLVTGLLKLKQTHNHWHQIQGNLHLTGANNCHLVVWTPLDLVILLIPKDPAWASNINILETF
ncbi:uncharacterized protein LOC130390529 [Gadus chalcogrammus]|uniref:uncharacterized protein LOC130390529 n=1 Tax=Gadus chalcogrammus TaxID=1042646 RepID=UPI0024C4B69A|nr:uncharacterized protein LOC130390529 [Gadus chalcogrammus]